MNEISIESPLFFAILLQNTSLMRCMANNIGGSLIKKKWSAIWDRTPYRYCLLIFPLLHFLECNIHYSSIRYKAMFQIWQLLSA